VLVARAEVIQPGPGSAPSLVQLRGAERAEETEQALTTYEPELSRHAALIASEDNQRAFTCPDPLQHGAISFPDLLQTQRNLRRPRRPATSDQA